MHGSISKKLIKLHGGTKSDFATNPTTKQSCVEKLVKILTTSLLCVTIGVATGVVIQRANICFSK